MNQDIFMRSISYPKKALNIKRISDKTEQLFTMIIFLPQQPFTLYEYCNLPALVSPNERHFFLRKSCI